MINKTTISAIRHLLREGKLSQRKIALRLGVSRKTVHNVEKESVHVEPKKEKEVFRYPRGPHRRCCHCGAFVQLPCLACQLRDLQKPERSEGQ